MYAVEPFTAVATDSVPCCVNATASVELLFQSCVTVPAVYAAAPAGGMATRGDDDSPP